MFDAPQSILPDLAEAFAAPESGALVVLNPAAVGPRQQAPLACLLRCLDRSADNLGAKGCAWLKSAARGEPDATLLRAGRCAQNLQVDAACCSVAGQELVVVSVASVSTSEPAPIAALNALQSGYESWTQVRALQEENEALADEVLQNYEKLNLLFDFTQRIAKVTNVEKVETLLMQRLAELLRSNHVDILGSDDACRTLDRHGSLHEREAPRELIDPARHVRTVGTLIVRESDATRMMVGPLRRLDDKVDVVAVQQPLADPEFTSGDVQLMESLLLFGGQILSNNELHQRMRQMSIEATRALVSAIDKKDHYTFGHSERVSLLARLTGAELGLPADELSIVEWAGLLHDVGKIGVPEEILSKPGKLTDEEFEQIKKHPEMGYEILQPISDFQSILDGVLYHHENPNGTGYPRGLRGDQIPFSAAIIHVVDVFDALTSSRSYRAAFSIDAALEIINKEAGDGKLNPAVVTAFLAALPEYRRAHPQQFDAAFAPEAAHAT
jgi:HD-GYP domain-containing protein (c-di-GMP phosphodiesterase class II)